MIVTSSTNRWSLVYPLWCTLSLGFRRKRHSESYAFLSSLRVRWGYSYYNHLLLHLSIDSAFGTMSSCKNHIHNHFSLRQYHSLSICKLQSQSLNHNRCLLYSHIVWQRTAEVQPTQNIFTRLMQFMLSTLSYFIYCFILSVNHE